MGTSNMLIPVLKHSTTPVSSLRQVIAALLLLVLHSNAQPLHQVPFFDDFEDNTWENNWRVFAALPELSKVASIQAENGNKVFRIIRPGSLGVGNHAEALFSAPVTDVSFYVKPDASDLLLARSNKFFFSNPENGGVWASIDFDWEREIRAWGVRKTPFLGSKWYKIHFRMVTGVATVTIDDFKTFDFPLPCTTCDLAGNFAMQLITGNSRVETKWDNIYVGTGLRRVYGQVTGISSPIQLKLVDRLIGTVRIVSTNSSGNYAFENVVPGLYSVIPISDFAIAPTKREITVGLSNVEANFSIDSQILNLTVITATGSSSSQVHAGDVVNITSSVPSNKLFRSWTVEKGSATIAVANSVSTQATIKKGDASGTIVIKARFHDPIVEISIKDFAAMSGSPENNVSKPIIRIRNVGQVPLSDFTFHYYFNVECFRTPNISGFTDGVAGLAYAHNPIGPGPDFFNVHQLLFTYSGTLEPGGTLETAVGELRYTCQGCNIWDRNNDYSNDYALFGYKPTLKIPLFLSTSPISNPIAGNWPVQHRFDPLPNKPPSISNPGVATHAAPSRTEVQMPNVVLRQVFQKGNQVSNGSFEDGTSGWGLFNWPAGVDFDIVPHGPTREELAIDGLHSAKVTLQGQEFQGIDYSVIDEEVGFSTIEEKWVTLNAWVKGKNGAVNPIVRLALVTLEVSGGSGIEHVDYGTPVFIDGSWQLASFTFHIPQLTAAQIPEFRFVVGGEGVGSGSSEFFVDAVTLTHGQSYSSPSVSYSLVNTRAGVMQSKVQVPAENLDGAINPGQDELLISNSRFDNVGRAKQKFLPFSKKCPTQDCNSAFDHQEFLGQLGAANDAYATGNSEGLPDAEGYAYAQPLYEKDQALTTLKSGAPGKNYQITPSETVDGLDHTIRTAYSGTASLAHSAIGSERSNPSNKANPKFEFVHVRDQDQNESMYWKNGFGLVEKSASINSVGGVSKFVVSENVFDDRGNVIRTLPPISCKSRDGAMTGLSNCVEPTEFFYDSENRLEKVDHPDEGATRYFYDLLGAGRIIQDSEQRNGGRFTVSVFDDLGRVRYSGEYTDMGMATDDEFMKTMALDKNFPLPNNSNLRIVTEFFYDIMPPAVPPALAKINASFDPPHNARLYPTTEAATFQNTHGKLCAIINYQKPLNGSGQGVDDKIEPVTTTAFKYDKFGQIMATYRYNGFVLDQSLKLQQIKYAYDVHGKVISSSHYEKAGAPEVGITEVLAQAHYFTYNSLGEVIRILNYDGKHIADYEYYPSSRKIKKVVLDMNGAKPLTVSYTYHINGEVANIRAERQDGSTVETIYSQGLYYDILPTGALDPGSFKSRFNGNVTRSNYSLAAVSPAAVRSVDYEYDNLDRLFKASYFLINGTSRTKTDKFSESITYEDDGRIKSMRRGITANNSGGGEYHYLENSNRLAWVEPGMEIGERDRSGAPGVPAFEYDLAGRLTYDQSKNLNIMYDMNSRPLDFRFIDNDLEKRHWISMRYDESGNRIAKMELSKSGLTSLEKILVDENPSRVRDYPSLSQALLDLDLRIGPMTQNPGNILIHTVSDGSGDVSLGGLANITSFSYQNNGKAGFDIVGLQPDEAQYQVLLEEHEEGFALEKGTHYTGIGNEVREALEPGTGAYLPKVLLDMPNGLGRYEHGMTNRLFSVKNHLGSTVASIPEASTEYGDMFEYFPIGKQQKAFSGAVDKVTQTFTGKELDEELALYYFGARYYDPELGVWISPDPLRQYSSSYTYCGNNPISCIDPDGRAGFFAAKGGDAKIGAGLSGYGYMSSQGRGYFVGDGKLSVGDFSINYGFLGPGKGNYTLGASAGLGWTAGLTTASSAENFAGISRLFSLELGFLGDVSIQVGYGGETGDLALSLTAGVGGGIAATQWNTEKAVGKTTWSIGGEGPRRLLDVKPNTAADASSVAIERP